MSFLLSLGDCTEALDAVLTGEDTEVTGVSTDTRTLQPGDLYIAIQGDRFNGHEFIEDAEKAGARAVLVHSRVNCRLPQLRVSNTRIALGQLARFWARRHQVPTIAITGSNGKTTVKEIVAAILRQLGPVLATRGNLNNDIGVPLTLLGLRAEHRYAVIEMGASAPDEIAYLVSIAEPDVAVVNNIGAAHVEGFGSVDAIAHAKAEIFAGLGASGWAVINADDAYADTLRSYAQHCHIYEFGVRDDVDVQGVPGPGLQVRSQGLALKPRFQLPGDHNGMNALAAVAVVQCLDVQPATIVRGLESVRPVAGRLESKAGMHGAHLIDDSYNANPVSARAAIDVLAQQVGVRYLVLGDMGELGDEAAQLHADIGSYARSAKLDGIWTVGVLAAQADMAFGQVNTPRMMTSATEHAAQDADQDVRSLAGGVVPGTRKGRADRPGTLNGSGRVSEGGHFPDQESLIQAIRPWLSADTTVLIKGSRSARMERIVKGLIPAAGKRSSSTRKHSSVDSSEVSS